MRKKLSLSLPENTYKDLENIRKALGHEEVEETLGVLTGIGMLAVGITTKQHSKIDMVNPEVRTLVAGYDLAR